LKPGSIANTIAKKDTRYDILKLIRETII